jgi:hypothetical protein
MLIDCHVHCGRQDRSVPQAYEEIAPRFNAAGLDGAVCFSPVREIYDRDDPTFQDTPDWQQRRAASHQYLLSLRNTPHRIYPFCFVWNDFNAAGLSQYCGVKWHRHANEPEYHYDDPRCGRLLGAIQELGLAVVLEVRPQEARLGWLERRDPRRPADPQQGMLYLDDLRSWARPVLPDGRLAEVRPAGP